MVLRAGQRVRITYRTNKRTKKKREMKEENSMKTLDDSWRQRPRKKKKAEVPG